MPDPAPRFVLCVDNEGYSASLETRKVYQELPDPEARARDLIRVVDESGEDYLFPQTRFVPVELSVEASRVLLRSG